MQALDIDNVVMHYQALNAQVPLAPIRTERTYRKAVKVMNDLLDAGGMNEKHPLAGLVEVLGDLIGDYEEANFVIENPTAVNVLQFFMEQHQLKQSDLPEIGSQGVVSEVLSGKRELNLRQIRALSKRFGVSPNVFFG